MVRARKTAAENRPSRNASAPATVPAIATDAIGQARRPSAS